MPKPDLGTLQELDPRNVWKNEEKDFTPWIADNCQQLSRVIGIPFTVDQTEKKVGGYELDIFGCSLGTPYLTRWRDDYGVPGAFPGY